MSRPVTVGVDPGTKGAIAALDADGVVVYLAELPVAALGGSGRNVLDASAFAAMLMSIARAGAPVNVWIERVSARPGQGVSSMFTFGRARGSAEGVVEALALAHPLAFGRRPSELCALGWRTTGDVTPQAWRKGAELPAGADKAAYHAEAVRRWPADELHGPRGARLLDRAAALLIADHGRRLDIAAGGLAPPG